MFHSTQTVTMTSSSPGVRQRTTAPCPRATSWAWNRSEGRAVLSLHESRCSDKARKETWRRDPVRAAPKIGVQPSQKIVQVSSNQSSELEEHGVWACHEQSYAQHADRDKLGRNGEKKEPSLLAPLILGCSVAHG